MKRKSTRYGKWKPIPCPACKGDWRGCRYCKHSGVVLAREIRTGREVG